MTKPITVLPAVVLTNNFDGTGSRYEKRIRSKQGKPYNEPAPYTHTFCYVLSAQKFGETTGFGGMANAAITPSAYQVGPAYVENYLTNEVSLALNSAREKLLGLLGDSAMMAVNYVERRQSVEMIISRVKQLTTFTRCLKRCDIFGAAKALSVSPPKSLPTPKGRKWRRSKDFADAWLEFHFGWEPLVQDIGACVEILQGPVPARRLTCGGKRVRFASKYYDRSSSYETTYSHERSGFVRASVAATFYVNNPDLYLANRLGFVNPAAVAWELIPFSFVVDWFTNVGSFLSQCSDLAGLTVVKPCYTVVSHLQHCRYTYHYRYNKIFSGYEVDGTAVYTTRSLGFPGVSLRLKPLKTISIVRGATAMALLTQLLPRK